MVAFLWGLLLFLLPFWINEKRSSKKNLVPYRYAYTSLFKGVDESLRNSLKIIYNGNNPLTDLTEVQFLIASNGGKAITNISEFLSIKIPEDNELLDVSLLYVFPEGRNVELKEEEGYIKCVFPLLNSGDYFIVKLLINGVPSIEDFEFHIEAEDLPPKLLSEKAPDGIFISTKEKNSKFSSEMFSIGLFFLFAFIVMACACYISWCFSINSPDFLFSFDTNRLIAEFSLNLLFVYMIMHIILSFLCILAAFSNVDHKRFRIPKEFLKRNFT